MVQDSPIITTITKYLVNFQGDIFYYRAKLTQEKS